MRRLSFLSLAILGSLAGAGPARCEISGGARVVVERYVEATGGRAALEAEHGTHAIGQLETGGLRGAIERWTRVPDGYAVRIQVGSLRMRAGTDGRTAWQTDLDSKHARRLDGDELERMRGEAWFENEMWARADQGGGRVSQVATSFRDGEVFHCLEVTPPVGAARRIWFSERTGLITRLLARSDQYQSELFLSEYRPLGGRKRPTVQEGVDPALAALYEESSVDRMRLDSLATLSPGDSIAFAPPAAEGHPIRWLGTHGVARIGFRYEGRQVWVRASINGLPPADFLLDTGASGTALDREYAEKVGLVKEGRFQVQGMGGSDAAAFADVRSIRITGTGGDGVELEGFKVTVVDLGRDRDEGRTMAGLIGYDVLGRFAVEIDYDRQVVTFHEPRSFVYRGAGATLDMKLMSGIPIVTVSFDGGCAGEFLVDVGNAFGTIVHGSLVRECRVFTRVADRRQVRAYGGGIGSGFRSWLCRLDTLQVGPFTICDPILALSLATRGMVGSEDYGGNLGNLVLERFKCTFDYLNRRLHLEPGARFARRDSYSRIGAWLLRSRERLVALGVVRGSPADEAGLEDHDEVIEIDGRPARSFTEEELERLLIEGEIGSTHTLKVLRDFRPATLTVTLRDVI